MSIIHSTKCHISRKKTFHTHGQERRPKAWKGKAESFGNGLVSCCSVVPIQVLSHMRRGFGGRLEYLYCLQSLITIFCVGNFWILVLQTQHDVEKEIRGAFGFCCYKQNMVSKKRQEELLDFGATNTTWCWKRDKRSFWFLVLQTQHGVEQETRGAFGFWCYKHKMVLKKRQKELLDFGATNTTWCWKRDKSSYCFFFCPKNVWWNKNVLHVLQ